MRKFILLLVLFIPVCVWAQKQYIVTGKIKNIQAPAKVFLSYRYKDAKKSHWDSTLVKNGAFEFRGTVTDTVMASVYVDYKGINLDDIWGNNDVDEKNIYLTNNHITLTGDDSVHNAKLAGSKLNEDYYKYTRLIGKTTSDEDRRLADVEFISKNPGSYISLDQALKDFRKGNTDIGALKYLFGSLDEKVRLSSEGIEYAKYIRSLRVVANGTIAPDFALPDTGGTMVTLSAFKGKYVLVDFWASWCGPCRQENPAVVKAYNRYKDKNFTIIGVSLDGPQGKEAWLKAIRKDGLTWAQVSDLKGWDNEVAKLYDVEVIPQNFLIGPDGKVIAQGLRGNRLEKKLAKIFDKQ
jgi:peroxiredoxin